MNQDLVQAVARLTERLLTLADQDDGLRQDLRALAGAVLLATERPSLLETPEPGSQVAEEQELGEPGRESSPSIEDERRLPTVEIEASPTASLLPLPTLSRARPPEGDVRIEPKHSAGREATTNAELPAIESRCRLKAEGIRWAVTRRRRIDEGAEFRVEISPRDREILDRARDHDCYLWMNSPDFALPRETAPLEDVAGCFEAVADAVALMRGMLPDLEANREYFEPALDLLAEAQSALKVAIDRIDGPKDQDQFRVYNWLRGVTTREQIYIRRHMRLDDSADPALLPQIERRIEALDAKFQEVGQRAKRRKSHLNRLRYHAKLIGEGKGREYDWRKVAGAIEDLVGEGMPVSSVVLREVLLPVLDELPDLSDLPPGFGLVLREIDRYLAGLMSSREVAAPAVPTADVIEAARLLSGKSAVLIGGNRRPDAYDMLKAALNLKELHWIETREHESFETFKPFVARPDVAVVLLAIRWSSHSFGDVKQFCDRYGKPMVRLPGGYNPNQVAAQIRAQCSRQLGDMTTE